MKKTVFIIGGIILLCLAAALLYRGRGGADLQRRTRFMMDTYCTIRVPGDAKALAAIDKAMDRMEEIDRKCNALDPKSLIYAFNKSGTPLTDPDIVSMVRTSLAVAKLTGGAFDITIYPLVDLWGFHGDFAARTSIPSKEEIAACMKKTGLSAIAVENGRVVKRRPDVMIDLGGIAKGYAVGEAAKVLKREGITSGLVDGGGNIYAFGTYRGNRWKVGIRDPFGGGVAGVVELPSDAAVVTSGNYERYYEVGGVRYHHILDPKTGYPSRGLAGISVVCPDSTLADGLSTSLFVLGEEKARALLPQLPGVDLIFIPEKGALSTTCEGSGNGRRFTVPR